MATEIISVILQLAAFTLIPFIVYVIRKKSASGFFVYIGLKKANTKANLLALLVMMLLAFPVLSFALFSDDFMATLTDPKSMTGKFREMGFTLESLLLLIMAAVFKTALSEEILFRGFLAKRLIAVTNYQIGNIIQAVIFGAIHTLLFLGITDDVFFLVIIFIFPSIGAYIKVYINEKLADGSIIPGWIAHASANLVSYSVIGFLI